MTTASVKQISESFVKPKREVEEAKKPYYLAPVDLMMLNAHYIQQGLLFMKPSYLDDQPFSIHKLLESLKNSLSLALVYFYPLAGQLTTQIYEGEQKCLVYVDCNKGPGARFIHATLDMTVSDILSATDVPTVVQSFFDHDGDFNYDGHHKSLLSIQVTELVDGVFIGCSMNHALGDGTSFWHFWNMWSEIHTARHTEITILSRMPILKRWFPEGYGPVVLLPLSQLEEIGSQKEDPCHDLRARNFHFSSGSIARLKARANEEKNDNTSSEISSFQALSALYWRAIIRALDLPHDQVTNCRLSSNNRHRLNPPLPADYFGNCISPLKTTTTVGELLENNLGWVASLVHQSVINYDDQVVRSFITRWLQSPVIFKTDMLTDSYSVMMGSSPRFDVYGNEFGLGKPVAVRRAYATKFVGKVTAYPGYEGGGSVDLEICLPPSSMEALALDEEFMDTVSPLTLPLKV